MVMITEIPGSGVVTLAITDPDLHLPKRRNMGYLDAMSNATEARDSRVQIELRGQWTCAAHDQLARTQLTTHSTTTLELICRHGATITLTATRLGST